MNVRLRDKCNDELGPVLFARPEGGSELEPIAVLAALDFRELGCDQERARTYATELVTLKPDAIFAAPSVALAALRQTSTCLICFSLK